MSEEITSKIENFFANYRLRHYAKGQVLMLGGETVDVVYYLIKGHVKVYDVTYRGDEVILNIFKPPAFFPMSIAINNAANPYVYEAESDVELRQAPAEAAVNFIKENPDVMYDLLSRLYKGVDGLLGRISLLMGSSAKTRLMYEIILEAKRFGSQDGDDYVLDIDEKGLGSRAGLSRETVNREIHKLKQDGLLAVRNKAIHIKNMPALQKKLEQEL